MALFLPHRDLAPRRHRGGGSSSALSHPFFDDNFFEGFFNWSPSASQLASTTSITRMDIKETDDAYLVSADMPGLGEKDVDLDLADGVLTISGSIKSETKEDGANGKPATFSHSERSYKRSFTVPENVDSDNIKAQMEHGVLRLSLPKVEKKEAGSKKIAVIGSGSA